MEDKVEFVMWGIAIDTDEVYDAIKLNQLDRACDFVNGELKPELVSMEKEFTCLLYFSLGKRNRAFKKIRKKFKTAVLEKDPLYVDSRDLVDID